VSGRSGIISLFVALTAGTTIQYPSDGPKTKKKHFSSTAGSALFMVLVVAKDDVDGLS
jgi:hypothetical protein